MLQFNATLSNELTRIFKKRKTIVFCSIDIAIIAIYVLSRGVSVTGSVTLSAMGSLLSLHGLFFMIVFPLYIFMETMDIFRGEMSNLTIRNSLLRPVSRTKLYLAKACAVCVFIFSQILFVSVSGAVASIALGDPAGTLLYNVAAFVISFIPMIALIFFTAFVSQIVKNGLLGMLLCIFFLLISYAAEALAPMVSAFLFMRHINMHTMLLTGNIHFYGIFSAMFIIAAYIGVTFTAGALLFERKEF